MTLIWSNLNQSYFNSNPLDRILPEPALMNPRRLTVSSFHPECRAARPHYLPLAPMPFLRLQGRWLDQAGFAIGANVRVEVTAGRLVVEVIDAAVAPR
jgi:hypothetical protein